MTVSAEDVERIRSRASFVCGYCGVTDWPANPSAPTLWNPRSSAQAAHLLLLADGRLHPITPVGDFTLRRLPLNRPALSLTASAAVRSLLRKTHCDNCEICCLYWRKPSAVMPSCLPNTACCSLSVENCWN